MASEQQSMLAKRQAAAQCAYDNMVRTLIGYSPCGKLTVDDILYIARVAQTNAFDAADAVSA